jgi:hypothetical protein
MRTTKVHEEDYCVIRHGLSVSQGVWVPNNRSAGRPLMRGCVCNRISCEGVARRLSVALSGPPTFSVLKMKEARTNVRFPPCPRRWNNTAPFIL